MYEIFFKKIILIQILFERDHNDFFYMTITGVRDL